MTSPDGVFLFFDCFDRLGISEKKRDTPNSGKRYKGIYNSTEDCGLASENPRNKIKAEKTDTAPVKRSDNCKS